VSYETTYVAAREAWDRYAALVHPDHPELPFDPLSELQVRLSRWQVENFGMQSPERFVLGIVEELGELGEAIEMDDPEKILDAIGDTCIYATQLASVHRLDFGVLLRKTRDRGGSPPVDVTLGRMAHAVLKTVQGIRGYDVAEKGRREVGDSLMGLLFRMRDMARRMEVSLEEVYVATAEHVLKRDWKAAPTNGEEE
jgi:NTP pyrophosphatase (non-canonical NTP hydrolase)